MIKQPTWTLTIPCCREKDSHESDLILDSDQYEVHGGKNWTLTILCCHEKDSDESLLILDSDKYEEHGGQKLDSDDPVLP